MRGQRQMQRSWIHKETELMEELSLLHKHGIDKVDPEDLSGLLREGRTSTTSSH